MPSIRSRHRFLLTTALLIGGAFQGHAWAHGDVTPQAVDTSSLPKLGDDWRSENPYRKNEAAIKVGSSAYNQNCARCHGLEAISGGIAPDLRKLDNECATLKDERKKAACVKDVDDYYAGSVRRGCGAVGAAPAAGARVPARGHEGCSIARPIGRLSPL